MRARVAASGMRGLVAAVVTGAGALFRAGPGGAPTAVYAVPGAGAGGALAATFLWHPAPKMEMAATAMAASGTRFMDSSKFLNTAIDDYAVSRRNGICVNLSFSGRPLTNGATQANCDITVAPQPPRRTTPFTYLQTTFQSVTTVDHKQFLRVQ
jgi:hypothetical protein